MSQEPYGQQYPNHPYPPAQQGSKPTKFGALAWTSLILGIVGIVGSPIIFLNNLTAVVAGVGVILGIIAIFGTRKILAMVGTALCIAAIAITVAVQAKTVEELDKIIDGSANQGSVSDGTNKPADAQAADGKPAETPTWGKRYTWEDGLAVEVAAPVPCKPGQYAMPQNVQRAVEFTITVVNGTDKPFNSGVLTVANDAQFNGAKAETVFDSNGECDSAGLDSATVLPGKTYTYSVAYAVGPQPGEMQLALQPSFGADKAVFTGQA